MLNMLALLTFPFLRFFVCLFVSSEYQVFMYFTMCDLMFEIKKYLNIVSKLHYSMLRSVQGLMLINCMCNVEFFHKSTTLVNI